MSANPFKKATEVLAKLGIVLSDENFIKRLHELRSQKNQLSSYLAKAERYKSKVSSITYEKVKNDYQKRLQEIVAEHEEKEKKLKDEMDLMLRKRDELIEMVKPIAFEYEELKFRCMVGEYTKAAFLSLASDKMNFLKDQKEKLQALSDKLAFYRLILNLQQEATEPVETLPLELEDFEIPSEEAKEPSFQPAEEETPVAPKVASPTSSEPLEEEFEFNFSTTQMMSSENDFSEAELTEVEEDIDLEQMVESEQAFVILKEEGQEDKPFMILPEESLTIGRAKDNTLRIDQDSVSRYHAKISFENGQVIIRDLGSANGTFVNGKKIKEYALADNDVILVGEKTKLIFKKL
jgi:hypothetical protein